PITRITLGYHHLGELKNPHRGESTQPGWWSGPQPWWNRIHPGRVGVRTIP
ncbi:unnamed protein product, partial [Closterium sp. Naga37s-1]